MSWVYISTHTHHSVCKEKIKTYWNETDIYVNQIVDLFPLAMKWTWRRTEEKKLIEIKSSPINHCVWSWRFFLPFESFWHFTLNLFADIIFVVLWLSFVRPNQHKTGIAPEISFAFHISHAIWLRSQIDAGKCKMQINPPFFIRSYFFSLISSDQIYIVFWRIPCFH